MDFHFLIRNAFSGALLMGAFIMGVWINDPSRAVALLKAISGNAEVSIAIAPIAGLFVQGLYTFTKYFIIGDMFVGHARNLVAHWGRGKLSMPKYEPQPWPEHMEKFDFQNRFKVCDDAIFVWLYHQNAKDYLIEWARRRRSYHYLGMSCPIAVVLGLPLGMLFDDGYAKLASENDFIRFLVVLVAAFMLSIPAYMLAQRMWNEADHMEAAWAVDALPLDRSGNVGGAPLAEPPNLNGGGAAANGSPLSRPGASGRDEVFQ